MKPGWLADDDDGGRGPMGEEGDDGERSHERRIEARYPAHAFPHIVAVRVRPGIQARLVDLSASGAQLETARRLWHGSFVHVQLLTDRGVTTVRARVVRNHVGTLSACLIRYRSAVRFDRRLTWPRREGHELGGEVGPVAPAGAEGLRQAMR